MSEWFRCVCALALLPMPLVDDECERLMQCAEPLIQRYPNLRKWCDSYINTYHEGKFPISLWHHFKSVGPRTNNHLEGYNNRLKTLSTAHPDIFSSIDLFRAEENNAQLAWFSAEKGDKPPYVRRSWVINEEELATFKLMLRENEITPEVYLRRVSSRLHLDKLQKAGAVAATVSSTEDECNLESNSDDSDN